MTEPQSSHSFWLIDELVALTIWCLDDPDLVSCARVCKSISRHALDSLYWTVHGLGDILNILAPLKPITFSSRSKGKIFSNEFSRRLTPYDWDRFYCYSNRVKHFYCDGSANGGVSLTDRAWLEIFSSIPLGHVLFPRLISITWTDESASEVPYLSAFSEKSLRSLRVIAPVWDWERTMLHLSRRCSGLEVLDFHLISQWEFLELSPTYIGLPNFLEDLQNLREIHLPMRHIPPEIIGTLSQMKNLHLLNTCPAGLERDPSMCCKPETDIYPDEVEFPSLSSLFLHMPFAPLQKCATSLLFAPQLSSLYIEIPDSVNPASKQFQLILKLVSEACMNLISLILRKSQPETPLLYPRERILFEAIRPALYLAHLRVFELYDFSPLCISDDEMAELASQWPEIEILRLCPEALQDSTVDLPALPSLASLLPLARHCPRLRHLGLQVDATVRVSRSEGDLSTGTMFSEELKELDLTWSKINSPAEVAAFLLEILPSHVIFSYRPGTRSLQSHTHWLDRPRNDPANKEHLRMWTETENILNALRPHRVMVDRMKRELIKLNEQLKWLEGI